ncbi:MAG TPA: creatininase family protein [Candidatus Xenobia bacterium]|nr:creatininase family protein [Candidatus Xenobia bacterium]
MDTTRSFLPFLCLLCFLCLIPMASAQELSSRKMDELNWIEFRETVPAKVKTVLLTTGTLEPHGVINNGADNLAPARLAEAIAPEVNALIAPHIPYGVTGSMSPYPGATHIPAEIYAPYIRAVLVGLGRNGFKNIVILNGHGGPQTDVLNRVAQEVALEHGVNTLVVNWWGACADAAQQVFGNPGGHAGENETAFIQAINPKLVHKELLPQVTATPNPAPGAWSATPAPSSIGLYQPDTGVPTDFDQKKADEYYQRVVACVGARVKDTLAKWDKAGFK